MKKSLLLIAGMLLVSCSNEQAAVPAEQTKRIDLEDRAWMQLSPTPVIKHINGKDYSMYGYNKQIPGPLITTTQGNTIIVDVENNIDFETTLHWHGARLENKFDGVPEHTQDAIQPGDRYRQEVYVPDEGIYWYHPHVREDLQQDMGLYGNFLVKPKDTNAYNPVNEEEVIILDDLMLDENGENVPYGKEHPNFALMGRFGNVMLVNGSTDYMKTFNAGSVVRFYVTNVANTRTFKFSVPGAKMKLVGSDVGRYEEDEFIDDVTIAPAERYIVEVLFEDPGTYVLKHISPLAEYDLGEFTVVQTPVMTSYETLFNTVRSYEDVIADIDSYREYFDRPIDKTITLDIEMGESLAGMDHGAMEHDDSGIEWEDTMPAMNATMASEDFQWKIIDEETGEANMDFMWEFEKGDIAKIRIINEEDSAHPMQHPIHFHGQRFLVLSIDGVKQQNLVWKDTVLVPIGSTADLLFDMSNPGDWMFHCHIAEHLSNGMMGMFRVQQ